MLLWPEGTVHHGRSLHPPWDNSSVLKTWQLGPHSKWSKRATRKSWCLQSHLYHYPGCPTQTGRDDQGCDCGWAGSLQQTWGCSFPSPPMHRDWEGFWGSLVLVAWTLLQGDGLLAPPSSGKASLVPCCWINAPQVTDPLTLEAIPTVGWPVSATLSPRCWGDSLSHPQLHSSTSLWHLVLSNFYFSSIWWAWNKSHNFHVNFQDY